MQIVYGLLCDRDGRPVAIEVFKGDAADPSTLSMQVEKLKRFGLFARLGEQAFYATIGEAVHAYLVSHQVEWVDWEDRSL